MCLGISDNDGRAWTRNGAYVYGFHTHIISSNILKLLCQENNIQQLIVNTLNEFEESLDAAQLKAEQKDEKKEWGFHKLPPHHKLLIPRLHLPSPKLWNIRQNFMNPFYPRSLLSNYSNLLIMNWATLILKHFKISPALLIPSGLEISQMISPLQILAFGFVWNDSTLMQKREN